ncbi:MAG: HAMP domain-containing histidine kinase [Bryobacterales bacterium]|nr:HAMP domain-containing histidine kinase [Bryobacterales bacterium]
MSPTDAPDLTLPGLVHDLKNVFQTILDAADLLAGDPRWESVAGTIQRSAEHGERLVRGVSQVTDSTFDFAVIAGIAVQFAGDFLRATHGPAIDFQRRIEPGLRIRGNPVGWERVLVNLLLNSVQAMPQGGRVQVTASTGEDGTRIVIADNGPGIPEEILPRIFDAHFSTKPSNTGIGLNIVRSIVRSNGGRVRAANRPEGGAEFVITLSSAG